MTRDRLVSVFVVLAAVTVCVVVAWLAFFRPQATVRRASRAPQAVVLVAPPGTPLPRDSGPKNNARRSKARKVGSARGQGNIRRPILAKPHIRPLPSKKRQTPKTTRKPRPTPHGSPQPAQASPQPPAKQCPPVNVPAPVPLTVTTPLVGVNC